MPPRDSGLTRQAVSWALLSQAIWLPLLLIAVHDRWLSRQPSSASGTENPVAMSQAKAPPLSLSDLVKAAPLPASRTAPTAVLAATPTPPPTAAAAAAGRTGLVLRSPAASPALQHAAASGGKPVLAAPPGRRSVPAPLASAAPEAGVSRRGESPSQLLGGSLGLQDLPATLFTAMAPQRQGAGSRRHVGVAAAPPPGSSPLSSPPSGAARLPLAPSGRDGSPARKGSGDQAASRP